MNRSALKSVRAAFVGAAAMRPSLPLHAPWAPEFFDTAAGWDKAITAAARSKPEITFLLLDGAFDVALADRLPGVKVGLITHPPYSASGEWPVRQWRDALDAITWFEPPPRGMPEADAIIAMPVDRHGITAPNFSLRQVLVPRWAAPSDDMLEHLGKIEKIVMLEPGATDHLALLRSSDVLFVSTYDAVGRLDPLPLQALAHGLLVVSTSTFPPLWGIESEDEFLHRQEFEFGAALDEIRRVPETTRSVRMRAFQRVREMFDAQTVFERLIVDLFALRGLEATGPGTTTSGAMVSELRRSAR